MNRLNIFTDSKCAIGANCRPRRSKASRPTKFCPSMQAYRDVDFLDFLIDVCDGDLAFPVVDVCGRELRNRHLSPFCEHKGRFPKALEPEIRDLVDCGDRKPREKSGSRFVMTKEELVEKPSQWIVIKTPVLLQLCDFGLSGSS